MPELPEVETIKATLDPLIRHKQIDHVTVSLPRIIQKPDDIDQFCFLLQDRTFQTVHRRGKFLRFELDGLMLVSHLRMEGRYGIYASNEPIEPHTHVIFHFTDGTELRYRDVRQFGTMHLFAIGEDLTSAPLNKLGVEPFSSEFTTTQLQQMLQHRTTKIKSFLLNQAYVTGLGNIYADEALYKARLHPERQAGSLSELEITRLYEAIVTTLRDAVEAGGSSIKSYVNGQGEMGMFQQQLFMYGRKDEPCPSCAAPIHKIVVSGRGTHYCAKCQLL